MHRVCSRSSGLSMSTASTAHMVQTLTMGFTR
jgi:hypothetical protein